MGKDPFVVMLLHRKLTKVTQQELQFYQMGKDPISENFNYFNRTEYEGGKV